MPFVGHVGPMAAIADELVRGGHEAVAYTGKKYRGRFEAVGACWLPWDAPPDFDDSDLAATFPRIGDGKGMRADRANVEDILLGTGAAQAADILAEHAERPFDAMVTDQLAFGGALAGEKTGTPWASVAVTPLGLSSRDTPPPGSPFRPATGPVSRSRDAALRSLVSVAMRWFFLPGVQKMRAAAGLGPTAARGIDGLYSSRLIIAQGVPGLDYPRSDQPAHLHYVGRLALPPPPDQALPDWWPTLAEARTAGRPVVHVTQGTLDLDLDDLVRPSIAALAGGEPLLVCTTGGAPVSVLGRLPGNVLAAPFVPHDLLLPWVDVMITNGGFGGVLTAVQAGVPLIVAGNTLDKPEVARRVAWSGIGLNLRTGRPSPAKVRAAVDTVLAQPAMRERAVELGAAMTTAGGARTAAKLVSGLL